MMDVIKYYKIGDSLSALREERISVFISMRIVMTTIEVFFCEVNALNGEGEI